MAGLAETTGSARESSEKPPALVFYSDILGFADFVRRRPADHVRRLLRIVSVGARLQSLGARGFDSLMFSDSLVIWSKDGKAVSAETVDQVLSVACSLLVSAMANRMPLSGAIACGEFFTESRETFFGKGLVAAVDAERAVKWVGVNIAANTANSIMGSARIAQGVRDLSWRVRESDGTLLVNPFLYLTRCSGESESQLRARLVGQDTMLLAELHALRFLLDTLGADTSSGRIVDSPAAKYLATVEFTRQVLGSQHFEVLSRVAMSLPDSSAWIESAY